MKIDCKIIEDLVPLYLDEVCSEESRKAIDAHIEKCENCRKLVKGNTEVEIPCINTDKTVEDKAVKKGLIKVRMCFYLVILLTSVLIIAIFKGRDLHKEKVIEKQQDRRIEIAEKFLECLEEGNYENATEYLGFIKLRLTWSAEHQKDTYNRLRQESCDKFCELGEELEKAGGISGCKFVQKDLGYSVDGLGNITYTYGFEINYQNKVHRLHVCVSEYGVENFYISDMLGEQNLLDDPFHKFSEWEYELWKVQQH